MRRVTRARACTRARARVRRCVFVYIHKPPLRLSVYTSVTTADTCHPELGGVRKEKTALTRFHPWRNDVPLDELGLPTSAESCKLSCRETDSPSRAGAAGPSAERGTPFGSRNKPNRRRLKSFVYATRSRHLQFAQKQRNLCAAGNTQLAIENTTIAIISTRLVARTSSARLQSAQLMISAQQGRGTQ